MELKITLTLERKYKEPKQYIFLFILFYQVYYIIIGYGYQTLDITNSSSIIESSISKNLTLLIVNNYVNLKAFFY